MNSSIMENGVGPVPFLSLYFLFNNVNRQNFAGFASQSNCIEAEDHVSFLVKVGPNNWLLEHIWLSSMSHHWTKKRAGDHTEHKSTKFILQYSAGHVQLEVYTALCQWRQGDKAHCPVSRVKFVQISVHCTLCSVVCIPLLAPHRAGSGPCGPQDMLNTVHLAQCPVNSSQYPNPPTGP